MTADAGETPESNGGETPPDDKHADDRRPETGGGDVDGLRSALASERTQRKAHEKQVRDLEARLQQFEDRDKSELEKVASRADKAERELTALKHRDLARTIAAEAEVSELWDLLHGDEEQMRAQAKRLAEREAARGDANTLGDLGAGARGSGRDGGTAGKGSAGFSDQLRRQIAKR